MVAVVTASATTFAARLPLPKAAIMSLVGVVYRAGLTPYIMFTGITVAIVPCAEKAGAARLIP